MKQFVICRDYYAFAGLLHFYSKVKIKMIAMGTLQKQHHTLCRSSIGSHFDIKGNSRLVESL